jgi:hypothetical protein
MRITPIPKDVQPVFKTEVATDTATPDDKWLISFDASF